MRSALTRRGILTAKEGHSFDRTTMALFYATDLADRIEHEIIPGMRSGFVVLADRYIYTTMARGAARGLGRDWLSKLYGFALVPTKVFFLRLDPDELIRRTLRRGGELDYWESGRDIGLAPDLYSSFRAYQTLILQEFDRMAEDVRLRHHRRLAQRRGGPGGAAPRRRGVRSTPACWRPPGDGSD